MRFFMTRATVMLAVAFAAGPVPAQIEAAEGRLVIELNAAETTAEGCSLSFLIVNGLPDPIDSLVVEAVLFDTAGQVERLTLFDFGALPVSRPRVRQFVLAGPGCEAIGAVLINGAETCETATGAPLACEDALKPRTRVAIDLIG
jgi:hypothetical protein